jgi:hypothetical protein
MHRWTGMTRIPTTLGTLLLAAQTLVVASTFLAVEADVRIVTAVDDGNRIVHALRDFHRDQARWPRRLGELVPKYLDRIPEPDDGRPGWRYAADAPAPSPSGNKGTVNKGTVLRLEISPETLVDAPPSRPDEFVLSRSWGSGPKEPQLYFDAGTGCWRMPLSQRCWQ